MSLFIASRRRASEAPPRGLTASLHQTRPVIAIGLLVASTWILSGLDASAKWLLSAGVALLVVTWARYIGHLGIALAVVLPTLGPGVLRSVNLRYQLARGTLMLCATLAFFAALLYLPQAQTTTIIFLAPPLVLVFAPLVLGERSKAWRWVAACIGFAGVVIVTRPGAGLNPLGTALAVVAALMLAALYLINRRVAADNPLTTLIWTGVVGSVVLTACLPFALVAAWPVLAGLTPFQWLVLAATGFWGALGQLAQIQAYRYAPASLLAPFNYMEIVGATIFGWWTFAQFPDGITWIGIAIICASGVGAAVLESRDKSLLSGESFETRTQDTRPPRRHPGAGRDP